MILKDVFSDKGFKEKFSKSIKKFANSPNIILFYEEGEIPENDKFLNLLKKSGDSQKFRSLEGAPLKNWIKKEIERCGGKAGPEITSRLVEFVGNDTWRLSNEIQKLTSFKNGKDIQIKDIELLVRPEIDNNIFKTIDAIALRNKKKALELLHKHLRKGDSPQYLLSMVNFQFRNLLMIKELVEKSQPYYSILRKTQLKPFVIRKSYQQAQRFGLPELKKIYRKIFQADLSIKTGKIEPETAIDLLISEI
jgi:DNA polymerase-3 subunit delta